MNATATARMNIVNHPYVASESGRCAVKGCYAHLRHHPQYMTAVYNWAYAQAVVSLPGAMSEGKLVACHAAAAKVVASKFRVR